MKNIFKKKQSDKDLKSLHSEILKLKKQVRAYDEMAEFLNEKIAKLKFPNSQKKNDQTDKGQ